VRIAVVNVNTSAEMTATIGRSAESVAAAGTEIVAITPGWGPESVEGYYDSFISAAAILDSLALMNERFDAVIWAGFGEHGHEGAQELLDVPVIDITHAAAMVACLVGRRYGIVTTLPRSIALIQDNLATAGLLARCAAIRATGLGVLDLDRDPEQTTERFVEAARACIDTGADVICLGCAGLAGIERQITAELGAPVVNGVTAAVHLAETCVNLGLRTSKVGALAAPLNKARKGWPISSSPPQL
jgi:allantoin racemase